MVPPCPRRTDPAPRAARAAVPAGGRVRAVVRAGRRRRRPPCADRSTTVARTRRRRPGHRRLEDQQSRQEPAPTSPAACNWRSTRWRPASCGAASPSGWRSTSWCPACGSTVERAEIDVEGAVARIRDTAAKVRSEAFPASPSPLCNWCDFRGVCPAFQGEGPDVPGMAVVELQRLRRRRARDERRIAELEQLVTPLRRRRARARPRSRVTRETGWEPADKPDSVSTADGGGATICLGTGVTTGLVRPTWCSAGHLDAPAWPCSGRGSPGRRRHRRRRCALTAPFHPYRWTGGPTGGLLSVALCRRVATPGGYPASCPVESGLSSTGRRPAAVAWPAPSGQSTAGATGVSRRRHASPRRAAGRRPPRRPAGRSPP